MSVSNVHLLVRIFGATRKEKPQMENIEAFTVKGDGIDEVAKKLGLLYEHVSVAKDPMFGWVQIVNDVTILGEQLRRNRAEEGADRAAKILFRLLEFLGYYLHTHKIKDDSEFADVVARELRLSLRS